MNLKKLTFIPFLLGSLVFVGCSSKNYYEPKKVISSIKFDKVLKTPVQDVVRDGVTFADGSVVTKIRGLLNYKIPKGYKFIYDANKAIVIADKVGNAEVVSGGKSIFKKRFDTAVIGASLRGNLLALIFNNNKIELYDMAENREIYKEELEPTFALDSRVANPIFVNDLVIFPALDGRLLVMDKNRKLVLRDIAISDKELFNNVIYLQEYRNKIVAATAYKVVSIDSSTIENKRVQVKDIIFTGSNIYIFTKSGKIIKTNLALHTLKEKSFSYAIYSAVTMSGYIYAIEKGGYLIKLDPELNLLGVYKLPTKIDQPIFAFKDRLFIGSGFIRLK